MTRQMLYTKVRPGPQFARSVNLERDTAAPTLEGYLPTARALDTLRRISAAMCDGTRTRAWSVTGPYGSGKSSLALLLDSLTGPLDDPVRASAVQIVADIDDEAARLFDAAVTAVAPTAGLIRAVATAQREPAARTIVRALLTGLRRYPVSPRRRRTLMAEAERLLDTVPLPARAVADLVAEVSQLAPVLLVVDEFGKNLEFFADRADDADLFVLQEVAERANGVGGMPVFFLTLQHLAFEEYATTASASQRREWAKVQGRFEDIAFSDSSTELLQLVARVMHRPQPADPSFDRAIDRWARAEHRRFEHLGIADRLPEPEVLAGCYPLHPLTLAVLPEICGRYGQRERTLFSFLARPEPHSVVHFLEETSTNLRVPPTVGVDRLFDYFITSAGTVLGAGEGASRWLEIDSRIRETQGLSADEQQILKVVGILNLASRGGSLRASADLLEYALPHLDLESLLAGLEARGLLVHRAFADEYRIWQGTDFDLQGSIDDARRRLGGASVAAVCERALPLTPLVAARHSQNKGILRFFERRYAAGDTKISAPTAEDRADGLMVYVVDGTPPEQLFIEHDDSQKPVLLVYPADPNGLLAAAGDAAAVADVLAADDFDEDWVARRELHERGAVAAQRFKTALDTAFSLDAAETRVRLPDGSDVPIAGKRSWSAVLSEICDAVYDAAPTIRNEMLARRELSSQAARARRDLLIAMVEQNGALQLGIEGYGPERAMFEAVLVGSGIYRETADGWRFGPPFPESDYTATWQTIERCFDEARERRVPLDQLWRALQAPPLALPDGPVPVVVTAALLARADDLAIYQDGTFQPVFGAELIERLIRTPDRFAIKHFATTGPRARVVSALAQRFEVALEGDGRSGNDTLIRVLSHLVRAVRGLAQFTLYTTSLSPKAARVREALVRATEPDELLFTELPRALDRRPFSATGRTTQAMAAEFADEVAAVLDELRSAYPALLQDVVGALAAGTGQPSLSTTADVRAAFGAQARGIVDRVIEPRLRSFLLAAADTVLDDTDWVENLAMNVAERPPAAWRDDDRRRFDAHLAELLSQYRRVEVLHLEHLDAATSGAVARQVTVTTPEGHSYGGVVWLDDAVTKELDEVVRTAVASARSRVGARAPDALLARLVEELMATSGAVTSFPASGDGKKARRTESAHG